MFQPSTHRNDSSVHKKLCKLQQISSVVLTPSGGQVKRGPYLGLVILEANNHTLNVKSM